MTRTVATTVSVIDFWYSGNGRFRALGALSRVYPRYSPARRLGYLVNAANVLTFRRSPRATDRIRTVLRDPTLEWGGAIAVLFHKINQSGRVYLFGLDGTGELRTVAKIGLTRAAREGIAREHAILLRLSRRSLTFQVPEVLSYRDSAEGCVLRVSAADARLRTHDKRKGLPNHVFDGIASLRPPGAPEKLTRSAFTWFDAALGRVTTAAIKTIGRRIAAEYSFEVSAAHRDLGSENVLSSAEPRTGEMRFAVLDWEAFAETAPAMTDRVAFWLGQHHRQFKRAIGAWREDAAAERFLSTFSATPGGVEAAVLALLGLVDIGNDLAERLCGACR